MIYTVTLNPAVDETLELESFNAGGVSSLVASSRSIGGKGINVARALGLLGNKAEALALVGENSRQFFEEGARSEGMSLHCFTCPGETRVSQTIVFRQEGVNTHIRRPHGAARVEQGFAELRDWLASRLERGDYLVLSGSLQTSMPQDAWSDLTGLAHEKGALPVLDTSGEALEAGLAARPFMLKINIDEFMDLSEASSDEKADFKETVQGMHESGIAIIVITMGAGGAVLSDGEGFYHARLDMTPGPGQQVWATGSGDAFLGGFVSGLTAASPLVDCLKLGVACGSVSTGYPGCAMFEKQAMLEALPRVELHREQS